MNKNSIEELHKFKIKEKQILMWVTSVKSMLTLTQSVSDIITSGASCGARNTDFCVVMCSSLTALIVKVPGKLCFAVAQRVAFCSS